MRKLTSKLAALAVAALAALTSFAAIETRDVTFPADEVPATNPRIERHGDEVTRIEVFSAFKEKDDGTFEAKVAETSVSMDAVAASVWVREARKALGLAAPVVYSKYKAYLALKDAGVWPQVKTWLEANDLWDAFLIASNFSEDDPRFVQGKTVLRAVVGWTDEQVAALLSLCLAD